MEQHQKYSVVKNPKQVLEEKVKELDEDLKAIQDARVRFCRNLFEIDEQGLYLYQVDSSGEPIQDFTSWLNWYCNDHQQFVNPRQRLGKSTILKYLGNYQLSKEIGLDEETVDLDYVHQLRPITNFDRRKPGKISVDVVENGVGDQREYLRNVYKEISVLVPKQARARVSELKNGKNEEVLFLLKETNGAYSMVWHVLGEATGTMFEGVEIPEEVLKRLLTANFIKITE